MRFRIIMSPAEKRNVTIDRCPQIKSREISASSALRIRAAAQKFPQCLRAKGPSGRSMEAGFGLPCLNHACDRNVKVKSDLFGGDHDGNN